MKSPFREGDTILVCRHIYEESSCKVVIKDNVLKTATMHRSDKPKEFSRFVDPYDKSTVDSKAYANGYAVCQHCDPVSKETLFIEVIWKDGRPHVADVLRAS